MSRHALCSSSALCVDRHVDLLQSSNLVYMQLVPLPRNPLILSPIQKNPLRQVDVYLFRSRRFAEHFYLLASYANLIVSSRYPIDRSELPEGTTTGCGPPRRGISAMVMDYPATKSLA